MGLRELLLILAALLCIGIGLLRLEAPRTGVEIVPLDVAGTPATVMRVPGAEGPIAVIVHGFAGSRQLMQPVQLTLARAGYVTVSFDLEGHGRNPQPMRGDVTAVDGTTQYLMDELARVIDAALGLPGADGRVALVGHSMASDIVVRQAIADPRIDVVVALSLFSEAVTETSPQNLLIINGAWEGRLRQEARRIMAPLDAGEGETVGLPGEDFARRAVAAPRVEHVGVLYSPVTLAELRDWLNLSFGRSTENGVAAMGPAILITLGGLVVFALAFVPLVPQGPRINIVPGPAFWTLAAVPALLTPLMLRVVPTDFLPVLVADYLALHLGIYGALTLIGLIVEGDPPRLGGWPAGLALAGFGVVIFGGVLDRYGASFMPHNGRWVLFFWVLPGAVLAMVAEATLIQAGRAPIWRRWGARALFLASLGLAVALDPARLFFLLMILPVILLFYLTFGQIGGAIGRRSGSAIAMGLGLGILLAWAIAMSFPLFDGTA